MKVRRSISGQQAFSILSLSLLAWSAWHGHSPGTQFAYVGPGAGFAFLGSFLALIGGAFLSLVTLLTWPFRLLWGVIAGKQGYKRAKVRKLIFLGLDGLDPDLVERYIAAGRLPNLAKLREQGGYRRLRTTFPALSPVAWSTFATGVNPARHNMFDFLNRSLSSYRPELASCRVLPPPRTLKLGRYRIPISRPVVEMRRKSQTFWQILGEHRVESTVLRVPITFPPENFNGRLLSAMSTPDLLGSQGTFALFTTRARNGGENRFLLERKGTSYCGKIQGPVNHMVDGGGNIHLPFQVTPEGHDRAILEIGRDRLELRAGNYSPWTTVTFPAQPGVKVQGIVRFLLTETTPEFSLYMTPINIDPGKPALPISHPTYYAAYLANLLGPFATLGMAEDTWALNERAIDERAFLQQAYLIYEEREAMFLSALDRTRRGVLACVFDTTDRVQHMFFRNMDQGGPFSDAIGQLYERADALVGKTLPYVDEQTVLFVLSDHGFAPFERGINLNAWLQENGYLALNEGASGGGEYLSDIDWSRTKAYTFGLAGIYLNLKGRESHGIVAPESASEFRRELAAKLSELRDPESGEAAVSDAWPSDSIYTGPYLDAAPDIIVGYRRGYRASWDAAVGKVSQNVFEDNCKAWSGDHCIDPRLVPGVLFCNRSIAAENPGIEDMAPTALDLFGFKPPAYMEGNPVLAIGSKTAKAAAA